MQMPMRAKVLKQYLFKMNINLFSEWANGNLSKSPWDKEPDLSPFWKAPDNSKHSIVFHRLHQAEIR
jgi:hypothetical protein